MPKKADENKNDTIDGGGDKGTTDSNAALLTELKTLNTGIANMQEGIAALVKHANKPADKPKKDTKKPESKSVELMTNADLTEHIVGILSEKIDGVAKQIGGVKDEAANERFKTDAARIASTHPDFLELGPEMQKVAEATPGLSVTQIYQLARAENPEKVKELEAKHAEKKNGEDNGGGKSADFGGMKPAGGKGEKQVTNMDFEAASQAAWDQLMGT
jgi:hypothetical protein